MLTMLLGGLWHGANWTFVIWGGLHGAYLAFERAVLARVRWWNAAHPFATALRVVVTFHLVCLAWVFFRARDLAGAHAVLANLARPEADANGLGGLALLLGAMFLLQQVGARLHYKERIAASNGPLFAGALAAAMVAMAWFAPTHTAPFIYFQF